MHLAISIAAGIVLAVYAIAYIERRAERRRYQRGMELLYPVIQPPMQQLPLPPRSELRAFACVMAVLAAIIIVLAAAS